MSNVEYMPGMFEPENSVLNSPVANVARRILPEPAKRVIRKALKRDGAEFYIPIDPGYPVYSIGEANYTIANNADERRVANRNFETEFQKQFLEAVKDDRGIVLDIGAAQGLYAIQAAYHGASFVYAIDPDPNCNLSLQNNLDINQKARNKVAILPYAVAEEDGDTQFNIDPRGQAAAGIKHTSNQLSEKITVPKYRVDSLIENGIIAAPSIVKIDVEGAEGLVIEGMHRLLSSDTPPSHLFIELHTNYLGKFDSSAQEVAQRILEYGYVIDCMPLKRSGEIHCHFRLPE